MAYEGEEVLSHTIRAANDFRTLLYRAVDFGGDLSIAGGVSALGITRTSPNTGQHMRVGVFGIMKAYAGAAITTPGYPLTTAATGFLVAAVSGSNVVGRYIGAGTTGIAAVASGGLFTGLFNFAAARPLGAGSGYV